MKGIRFFQTINMKLIIIYVLLILIAMQLIGVYFYKTMESSFMNNFKASMNKQGNLLAEYVKPYLNVTLEGGVEGGRSNEDLNDVVNNFNKISGAEIQVIDTNGVILSSSVFQIGVNQKNTEIEVSRALQGLSGNEWDTVDSLGVRKRAMALPVWEEGRVIGAVYLISSMEDLFDTIERINRIFIVGTVIALSLTGLIGIILANTITQPIKEITSKATAMAEGQFNQRVKVSGRDEIGQLGYAFNYMSQRLKEALSSVEEEKNKLASILANMSDGVVATDQFGRIILMNRRAEQMLEVSEAEVSGQMVTDLLGEVAPFPVTSSSSQGEVESAPVLLIERPMQGDTEEMLKVRVSSTPILNRERMVAGVIVVLQDVTEQEKMEQSRRDFVANVSHELRTPLTSIKSYLEALDDGAIEDPQLAKRFLGVTRNEAERMIRLVTDLLQLSRLDSNQAYLHKEPTDLRNMLEDVADRFSFQAQQRGIDISLRVDDDLERVSIDSDQIDQVLDNLVSNAIKYTPDNGFIEISADASRKDWVEIAIEDTGMGIPKKDLSRIFERFYRVDKARSRNMGGTGLGLSIAREIVKAHGGQIQLESEYQKGTRVSFTLWVGHEEDAE